MLAYQNYHSALLRNYRKARRFHSAALSFIAAQFVTAPLPDDLTTQTVRAAVRAYRGVRINYPKATARECWYSAWSNARAPDGRHPDDAVVPDFPFLKTGAERRHGARSRVCYSNCVTAP